MTRVARGTGVKALGGRPVLAPPSLRVACPKCDARIGERCRSYKVENGERLYIKGYLEKRHPERLAAAQKGAA